MKVFRSVKDALDAVVKQLQRLGWVILDVSPVNFNRQYLISALEPVEHEGLQRHVYRKLLLTYQKRWFESFSRHFPAETGFAATLNLDLVEFAAAQGCIAILIAKPEGEVYYISPREWLDYALKRRLIRKTEKTGETTVHIPVSRLKLFLKEQPQQLLP